MWKNPHPGKKRIVFLHIPKAAGSTLNMTLRRYYSDDETFTIVPSRFRESMSEFIGLPYERRARIMLLTGHMPFGLHEYLPQPASYITMLRHPVQRVVSHYNFARRSPRHYLYDAIRTRNLGMEEYITSGISTEMDNGQVRLLTAHGMEAEFGKCPPGLLDEARANLSNHFVVGLSERFDESLLLLKKRCGWTAWPFYQKRNVAPRREPKAELSTKVRDAIYRHNALDCELYDWAAKRLESELRESGIQRELNLFVSLNSAYQTYARLALRSRRGLERLRRGLFTRRGES